MHIYEKFKTKMSISLTENAFESSLFHTFDNNDILKIIFSFVS